MLSLAFHFFLLYVFTALKELICCILDEPSSKRNLVLINIVIHIYHILLIFIRIFSAVYLFYRKSVAK